MKRITRRTPKTSPPKARSKAKTASARQAKSQTSRSRKVATLTERKELTSKGASDLKRKARTKEPIARGAARTVRTRTATPRGSARPRTPVARKTEVSGKLAKYRSMRDFGKTPEPQGKKGSQWKTKGNPFFVIQKHAASRLHYDFRLEVDGVLWSWAVPKGPSMDPSEKRLAVHTEDHPIDYADFEGIIPEDEYGGGTVIVWDAGPYRNLKRKGGEEVPMQVCHDKGQIEFWLEGKKIRGGFVLVHSRMGGQDKNWLLIKLKDEEAGSGDPVRERTESVISGRTIEQVATRPRRVWTSR